MTDLPKRIRLTNQQKMEICAQHSSVMGLISQGELRKWAQKQFNLPTLPSQALISHILKNKRTILERGKSKSTGKSSKTTELVQLEKILLLHIQAMSSKNIHLSGPEIRDYAEVIATQLKIKKKYKFSNGWLQNFRQRNQLKKLPYTQIIQSNPESITSNNEQHNECVEAESDKIGHDNDSTDYDEADNEREKHTSFSTNNDELEQSDSENQEENKATRKNRELVEGLEKVLSNLSPETDEEVIFAMTASKMLYKLKSDVLKKKIRTLEET